jgi:hypothetical protein
MPFISGTQITARQNIQLTIHLICQEPCFLFKQRILGFKSNIGESESYNYILNKGKYFLTAGLFPHSAANTTCRHQPYNFLIHKNLNIAQVQNNSICYTPPRRGGGTPPGCIYDYFTPAQPTCQNIYYF